jgi:hypothetical protein
MPTGLDGPSLWGLLTNLGVILGVVVVIGGLALLVRLRAPITPTPYLSMESLETHGRLKEQE